MTISTIHKTTNTPSGLENSLGQLSNMHLLIAYPSEDKLKQADAQLIAEKLREKGHHVTVADIAQLELGQDEDGKDNLVINGESIPASSFDGAMIRSDLPNVLPIETVLSKNNVALYQTVESLQIEGDKIRMQQVLDKHNIPCPKTFTLSPNSDDDLSDKTVHDKLVQNLGELGDGPYVIKKSMGWNGDFVSVVDSKEEALTQALKWYSDAKVAGVGGVVMQEFIESNPERRRDYRVHTIVGVNHDGQPVAHIVGAISRVAQPGVRVTNTAKGAEPVRVSLSEEEARRFYVEKKGMPETEFQARIDAGTIEILSPAMKKLALEAAAAYGAGSLGLDIIVGEHDQQPRVLEVNPFAGGAQKFEKVHGFDLYNHWADAFVSVVQHEKIQSLQSLPAPGVFNTTTHKARVMIMVESDNGFGHFNIVDQVAQHIGDAGHKVAVVSGTFFHPGGVFEYGGGQQYHLPTLVWDEARKMRIEPVSRLDYEQSSHLQAQRKAAVKKACEEFKPDVIVFELYPFMNKYQDHDRDAIRELYPDPATRPRMVCLSRDIIHSVFPEKTVDKLNNNFDHVVVRGDGKLNKLEDCQEAFANINIPVEYLGNIVSTMPQRQPMADNERPVLVFSGGGYRKVDKSFFEAAIQSRAESGHLKNNPWMIIVSNNCSEGEFQSYKKLAQEAAPDGSIHVMRPFGNEDFRQIVANSAAAIVRGSYNTTFELTQAHVPFVVVPRGGMGHDDEQIMRGEVLEKAGLARNFVEGKLKSETAPKELAEALDGAFSLRPSATVELDYNGATRIASRLVDIAQQHHQEEHPTLDVTDASGKRAAEHARQMGAA